VQQTQKSKSILDKYRWLINAILFIWSLSGTFILTFGVNGPFIYTGNGYFSVWAMLLASIWNYGVTYDMVEKELLSSADSCIYGLGIASIILVIKLSTEIIWVKHARANPTTVDPTNIVREEFPDQNISLYTLILSVVSIIYGLLTAGRAKLTSDNFRIDPKLQLIFISVFVVLWLIAACLCTFIGPFSVRNDYNNNSNNNNNEYDLQYRAFFFLLDFVLLSQIFFVSFLFSHD
jgi:hypothetical protein